MAGNINEAGIFIRAQNLPLMADVQYMEPYSSSALNRKMLGIILPGVFRGFNVTPGTGLNIVISSTAEGTGSACIEVNGYQITVQQTADVTVAIPKGQTTIVALEANYGQGTLTKQVSAGATLDAARFVTIAQGQSIKANQIEICRVTLSASATSITQANINMETRTRRRVAPIISDAIDSHEQFQVASSNAVRLAMEASLAEINKRIARGENGLGVNGLTLDQSFDWQTHDFKSGEYIYFNWSQAANNPTLDYPDGYYQIMTIGLAMSGLATVLIRPINYQQPLAPFMISWTGDAGSRVFRFRAVVTDFGNMNELNGIGPNNLNLRCHVGIFGQPEDAGAVVKSGYPVAEAGTLHVTSSAYTVQQEYVTYSTGRRFVRGLGAAGAFQDWKETPNLSNDALWQGGKKLGLNAVEENSVYFENATGTTVPINTIVGGVRNNWYTHNSFAGLRRDGSNGIAGYSIEVDGLERFRIDGYETIFGFNSRFASKGNLSGFRWLDDAGLERASFNVDNSTNKVLELWTNDSGGASHWQFTGNSIYNPNTISGANNSALAGLRCVPETGAWGKWRDRASGLQVDVSNDSSAVNVWKATQWGVDHLAAMQVAAFASNNSAQVQLNVKAKTFSFDSEEGFNAFKITTDWLQINANGGKLTIGDNDSGLYAKADGAVSLYTDGVERGYFDNHRLLYSLLGTSGIDIGDISTQATLFSIGNEKTSAQPVTMRLWGKGERATVLEVGDTTGNYFFAQRRANGNVELETPGKITADTIAATHFLSGQGIELFDTMPYIDFHVGNDHTRDFDGRLIETGGSTGLQYQSKTGAPFQSQYFRVLDGSLPGAGGYAGQLNALAPLYLNTGVRVDGDNTYFPLAKGRTVKTSGWPTAVSFGFVTNPGTFPNANIQVIGDNTSQLWTFNGTTGSFNSPGGIWSGGEITAALNLRAGNTLTWGASGAATATNGDVYGPVYGKIAGGDGNPGWASSAIGRCWQRAVDGMNTSLMRVSEIHLGALVSRQFWSGNAAALGSGDNAVMVSITFVGGSSNEGTAYFRYMIYNLNGSLVTVPLG